jgi:hypothetical protein
MSDSGISFRNLGFLEVALVYAAVLLLSGARNLVVLSARSASPRTIVPRAYFFAVIMGVGCGTVVAALALPENIVTALTMAVGVAGVLLSLGFLRLPFARRLPWEPGMAAATLISFGLTVDVITRFWLL